MKLTSLFLALCLIIIGVLSAALEPNIGPALARDPAARDTRIVPRGCWRPRNTNDSPDNGPPPSNIDDSRPGESNLATTPDQIFGTTTKKKNECPHWDPPYGCGRGGYCWRTCGFFAESWCWIALDEGIGPWQRCSKAEECKREVDKSAKCCTCARHKDCGCGCPHN